MSPAPDTWRPGRVAAGRYLVFFRGEECGEERWAIERGPDGYVASGEQDLHSPHPLPAHQEYRATLSPEWRLTGLEVRWTVGGRALLATHRAEGGVWRVRIEYQGQVKEQQGDYPDFCEVDYGTHLMSSFFLARRDFAIGGEHEFPALRIGPPFMAVTPERMLVRCVERRTLETPLGPCEAKRYVVSLPPRSEAEGYTFWADPDGFVLESYDDLEQNRPWMRLVELVRG
jgi:hypothetical protein